MKSDIARLDPLMFLTTNTFRNYFLKKEGFYKPLSY
ncbi:hypothetical protein ES708_06016 [subsurface metagenome]